MEVLVTKYIWKDQFTGWVKSILDMVKENNSKPEETAIESSQNGARRAKYWKVGQ